MPLCPERRPLCGRHASLRLTLLPVLVASAFAAGAQVGAPEQTQGGKIDDVSFDAGFFPQGMAPKLDISRFGQRDYVVPGTYRGDVVVNQQWRAREDVVFAEGSDGKSRWCFSADSLLRYGIDIKKLSDDPANPPSMPLTQEATCDDLGDYVPGAGVSFDSGSQVLSISVPQVYTRYAARGYVDPSQWNAGTSAAVLGYTANFYRSSSQSALARNAYVGVNASLHAKSWQFYHVGAASWGEQGFVYRASASWLQHDLPSLRTQLMLGDTVTPGQFFDPVRIRGVRLQSDDRMLPQSLRGYAPVVRGVADTNARIVIRQRGSIIYETNVSPGAFAVEDLYATGYGGDLDVEIHEADGRVRRFSLPFSNVNQLLRPGQARWVLSAGQIEAQAAMEAPRVVQGTYQRGISNALTGFAGITLADGYRSYVAGGAFNTPWGAVSADLTQATSQTPGLAQSQGASLRVGYNKNFVASGTDLAVAAYRYSTSGFVSLPDAVALRDSAARGFDGDIVARQRSRMDISINQRLGDFGGQVYLIGSTRDFWTRRTRQVDFTAGYSNRWRQLGYTLSVQRSRDTFARLRPEDQVAGGPEPLQSMDASPLVQEDTRVFLTLSLPLGTTAKAPSLTGIYNQSRRSGTDAQVGVNGMAGSDARLSYGGGLSHQAGKTSWNANGQYRGGQGQAAASYSRGDGYTQVGAGLAGGVVLHADGFTFAPPVGDTLAIIHAPGAAGATIDNGQGAKVNAAGFAIVPYLSPYELNTVVLDPKGADVGVEFEETTRRVAPRAGAVVRLEFKTRAGRGVIVDTRLNDGRAIPFGAEVLDVAGISVGTAGQGSRLVLTGLRESGLLVVRWGEGESEQCRLNVQLPEKRLADASSYESVSAICQVTPSATLPAGESSASSHAP